MDWKKILRSKYTIYAYVVLSSSTTAASFLKTIHGDDPPNGMAVVVPMFTFILSTVIAWILHEAWRKTHDDLVATTEESARVREVGICALKNLLLSVYSFAHLAIGGPKEARGLHDRRRTSVHHFLIGAENLGMTFDEVLSVIKESSVDVLFLQDAVVRWRNGREALALLPWADALVAYVHRTPTSLTAEKEAAFREGLKQK